MVGTKTGTKVVDKSDPRYKKHPEHESVENEDMSLAPKGKGRKAAKALYKEGEWADEKRKEKESSDRLLAIHQEREKRYQAQQAKKKEAAAAKSEAAAQIRTQAVDVINAIQFGKPFKVVDEQEIASAELREKEAEKLSGVDQATMAHVKGDREKSQAILKNRAKAKALQQAQAKSKEKNEEDDRRTVDAIRAYDKSKDASRDADWDTVHGKIKQGKKEKKYAKKERGEIGKDDPDWKSRAYHTGMHGEEIKPLSQALIDAVLNSKWIGEDKLSYKERQKLPSGSFALPGKGSGPEGKQGGSYPIPDESHARNALARVSQHGSEAEKAKVRKAVASKFPNIKIGEEKDDRGIGSTGYADYVKGLTPGAVKNKDAKKASSESKKASDEREHQATRIDDEYVPTLEEYAAHLDTLDEDALETELENLSQNELLELLGSGLVKKAVKGIAKRFSTGGRLAAAKKKAVKIKTKTDLATTKTSNIAAKAKLKDAKAKLRAARSGGAQPVAAEYDPAMIEKIMALDYEQFGFETQDDLIEYAVSYYDLDELSKKTLGSYIKKRHKKSLNMPDQDRYKDVEDPTSGVVKGKTKWVPKSGHKYGKREVHSPARKKAEKNIALAVKKLSNK